MSTQFQVDTGQIQAAAADIRRISASIEAEVAAMTGRLAALQESWRGSAAAGFQGVVTTWSGTQRQVRAALDQIEAGLTRAGVQYAEIEAANASLFRG